MNELFGEIRGKTVSRSIKEITPLGVRLELNNEGHFAGAKYNAAHMETVHLFQNLDGTLEWTVKAIENTPEGDVVVINGKGTGRITGPTSLTAEGQVVYMTQSPRLSSVNGTKGRVEVTSNTATGEFTIKVYSR
jgi:hypothetical protein